MTENKAKLNAQAFDLMTEQGQIKLYSIKNSKGSEAHFINQGAKLVSLVVPSKDGWADVVIGHDSAEEYLASEEAYFGAICGRYANRIAKGKFSIDREEYTLAINNGPNALHGGLKGFNSVLWTANELTDNKIEFSYLSPDGEEGYPGELDVRIVYTLTDGNALEVEYFATTNKATVVNLTNHSYFNLSGNGDQSVHDHILEINAKSYLPTDETAIPYGEPKAVTGTPFDFQKPTAVGLRIDEDMDQLKWARGYDHTYILDKEVGSYGFAARCSSPKTGIVMEVHTDQPGVQLYTGNWMSGNMRGKHDAKYPARAALCLETQHYPDSPNHPDYPTTRLNPDEKFYSKTSFIFSLEA